MPSLYFNRIGRVFSEADVSQKEIEILLAQEMRGGPRSLAAWLMNQPNSRRLIGGIPDIDDDSEPLLSDGQNSNSPSPNRRPLALHTDDDQSDNEAASFYDEASTLAGHGFEALPRRLSPEMKESFRKIQRFQTEWENFIDSMVKEWKTLNVVSALLLSALLTVFQIQDAQYVPVTRTAALLSLICAFMSLMFGGMYIIRFSTMRTMRKAVRWIEETHKKKQKLLWNIWIMLSLPVMWLVYSLLFFCITILGFVWTSGTGTHVDPPTDDDRAAVILGPRIGVTVVFAIGFVYFCLVLNTFRVWSGVTISPNNDTLVNLNSPDSRANMNDLETSALALAGADNQSPPALPKTIHELDTIVPVGAGGQSQSMDALQALGPSNATRETRQQRSDEIIRGLEERGVRGGSVGSTPSVLRLEGMDLTFTPADRVASLRHSPNLVSSTLTSTPPKFISSDLPPPNTIVTQPTPVAPTFTSKIPDAAPLTAVDPLMAPNGPWGLQDPLPANSPPFTRHSQAMDLDDALPDRRTPPSTFASVYATPKEEAVSEFGTINRAGGRMGGGI
ncbi:hypothetical protein M408DRAFT_130048 [Serendipita vermifera MAFF 305830]|uniref:Transmembrane protein n=1 Tax=Serendipita vermifera MAFF 305830 TaxID=933852 RepID=A0A0C3AMS1_SERVB|nr:hypothetical protein M408DRAFT_130048 [Serendipita vermifera MAFF 305830]